MDMNRKKRSDLKNKIHLTALFMIKFVLVLAIFGMLTATAHAGAFLKNSGDGVVGVDGYTVVNRSDFNDATTNYDIWADDWETNPLNLTTNLDSANYDNGIGYYAEDSSEYTGFYIGTFTNNANDDENDLLYLIEKFLEVQISEHDYAKVEMPDDTPDEKNTLQLTVDYKDDNKSGTWTVTDINDDDSLEVINFYSVKGGPEFALYYVDPADSSGVWTTRHLQNNGGNIPGLSHLSVVMSFEETNGGGPGGGDPMPEPTTMLLFGFSLIGLAGMARRKNSKF